MIEFKNTAIGYENVLFTIPNLTVKEGNVYALIGANGSGKSTLLQSLIGKNQLKKGTISIKSNDLTSYNSSEIAKIISFVESKFDGIEFLTVREYISLGRAPYTDAFGRLSKLDTEIVDKTMELMNLSSFSSRYTTKLSDGERQLASIARSLAQTTPIILLDEPTAFLDYGNRKKVIHQLTKIAKEENKCILFSTHDLDLCIEEELTFLLLNTHTNQLEELPSTTTKKELIEKGFGI